MPLPLSDAPDFERYRTAWLNGQALEAAGLDRATAQGWARLTAHCLDYQYAGFHEAPTVPQARATLVQRSALGIVKQACE